MDIIALVKKPLRMIRNTYRTYLTAAGGSKSILPSQLFVPQFYKMRLGKKMHIHNPVELSEKLSWMKIYYHDPLFTICADKYRMREYVKLILGEGYTPKLLGKWDKAEDIDFDSLPNQFVIKTNHDGSPIICLNKSTFDCEGTRKRLSRKLNNDYYKHGRQWGYKNIRRCIFAEEYLGDGEHFLLDYKCWCFNGEPKFFCVQSEHKDMKTNFSLDYFDTDFNHLPFRIKVRNQAEVLPNAPDNLDEMVEIARKLSSYGEGIPFVRVDMYSVMGRIYVGEMTFYPWNGTPDFDPPEWNTITGDYLVLPDKNGWKYQKGRDNEWIRKVLTS